jgi:hypothetical protein
VIVIDVERYTNWRDSATDRTRATLCREDRLVIVECDTECSPQVLVSVALRVANTPLTCRSDPIRILGLPLLHTSDDVLTVLPVPAGGARLEAGLAIAAQTIPSRRGLVILSERLGLATLGTHLHAFDALTWV